MTEPAPATTTSALRGAPLPGLGLVLVATGALAAVNSVVFLPRLQGEYGRLADRVGAVPAALRALWVVAPITLLYGVLRPD